MAVAIRLTSAACFDLVKAHDWYERQATGLGKEFLRSVDAALAFIERHPELLAPAHRHLRRALTKRFPYAVYYENLGSDTVRVIAVLHTAMDTGRLTERTH